MDGTELYKNQMALWLNEQQWIKEQLERTIKHYEDLAEANRQQLEIQNKRIGLAVKEYEEWQESMRARDQHEHI